MEIAWGIILIVWGMAELHVGKAWFISRFGIAKYTLENDDWVFLLIAWLKVVGGALYVGIKVITAGAVLAVLDEVKKLFITGRHLSWPEAGLNAVGIVCGVLFSLWILRLIARAKKVNS